uniref:Uncharacterized protein n=1 Tax=Lepeophtheirus salmonis TaxID=72036 RepID=A0A0K2V808_LEPSM
MPRVNGHQRLSSGLNNLRYPNQSACRPERVNERGGLSTPSDLLYISCLYDHSIFSYITATPEEKDRYLVSQILELHLLPHSLTGYQTV